jgi:hypothetical protein
MGLRFRPSRQRMRQREVEASIAPLVAALEKWAREDPEGLEQEMKALAAAKRRRQLKRSKKVPRQVRPPRL